MVLDEDLAAIPARQFARTPQRGERGVGGDQHRERDAREARNPKSGEVVDIPGKRVPFFKTGKELRERVASA